MQEEKTNPGITRRKFIGQATALSAFFIIPRHVLGGKGYIAPSDKITIGFIGNGKQGLNLQRSFLSTGEVQILATCDVYKAKTKNFVDKLNAFHVENKVAKNAYKSCDIYYDFRQILSRKDIDAVLIAAPDFWHAVLAVKAAEAGKDIYCEKPLALTIKEGRAMVNAVHKNQRVFQTGSMQRSWPEFRQTVELVRNGYIGDIKTIKVSVGGPPVPYDLPKEKLPVGLDWDFWLGPNFYKHYNHQIAPAIDADFWAKWRDYKEFSGGGMTDWGAHMFDIVQWALDMDKSGPIDIIPPNTKENLFLTYRYDNGITMTHENFGKNNAIRFIGSKGQIDIQRHKLVTTPESLKDKVIGPNEKHVYFSDNHYKDWLNAIRKRTVPICGVETGHRSATVCNLGNIAYELKRPLKWNPETEKFVNDDKANSLCGRKMRHKWKMEI